MTPIIAVILAVAAAGAGAAGTGAHAAVAAETAPARAGEAASAGAVATPGGGGDRGSAAEAEPRGDFTPEEIEVIRFITGRILQGEPKGGVAPSEIASATGVAVDAIRAMDAARLSAGILAELGLPRGPAGGAGAPLEGEPLAGCSLERDLTGASPEEMAVYHADRAREGEIPESWRAPDFILPLAGGGEMGLSELAGRPAVLAFVSGHCSHSLEIIRRIAALRAEYGMEGLAVVGVYVNSGSREDVHSWTRYLNIDFPLLVAETPEIADRFGFRTVPTLFLLDETGRVRSRLVGEKDRQELRAAFSRVAGRAPSGGP